MGGPGWRAFDGFAPPPGCCCWVSFFLSFFSFCSRRWTERNGRTERKGWKNERGCANNNTTTTTTTYNNIHMTHTKTKRARARGYHPYTFLTTVAFTTKARAGGNRARTAQSGCFGPFYFFLLLSTNLPSIDRNESGTDSNFSFRHTYCFVSFLMVILGRTINNHPTYHDRNPLAGCNGLDLDIFWFGGLGLWTSLLRKEMRGTR
jgi:hypothetical protein